ncbi:MAG: putative LPS assembly protein LptD, partial [Bacteroidota bacterium]
DSVYFLEEIRLTTSDHPEDPEYYIRIRKGKVVPKKKIIAGLSNMYIADVPTPIGVPFAYFPLTQERKSGFIFPTFGEVNNRGYFVQNGGYYFAVSNYFDLAILGDYYTNGSYGLRAETNYAVRYKFRGNLAFRFENLINSQRGFPDYSRSTVYNIRWSHSQDTKSSPNSRFSASVNLGSSRYYQLSYNQLNTPNFLNNTLASSISYSKTFPAYPSLNISLTATHSQNTNTQSINMTLPALQANLERIFPFAPREGIKKGVFQNINFQYSLRAENRIETTDSLFFKREMFEDSRVGFSHRIPISTNFKIFKYLSTSLSANYDDVWYLRTIQRNDYDALLQEATIDTINGFDRFSQYNFSAGLGTTIYGTFNFGEDKKIQAIRHVMRPSVSYSYNPGFNQYYDEYNASEDMDDIREYTRFEGGIFGTPGRTNSNSIGFSLSNTFEAKVRDRDTTATEPKKIVLLNNLNFSGSYNIAADSLAWSPIRVNAGTQLFKNKMNINLGATLDPYAIDNNGTRIDVFNIDNGGSLFRLTGANLNINYSFSSSSFESTDNDTDNTQSGGREDDLFGKAQDFSDSRTFEGRDDSKDKTANAGNYRTKLPWDLRLAYSLSYSNSRRQNEISTNSLMFSGNIELSPRWKVGASSGYDFKSNGFTYTQLRFERDLESWRMSFNWVPFSSRSSWYFFIGIKSSILSDVKWDKRREPDRNL